MPKKAIEVPYSLDGRRRISVDLEDAGANRLQHIMTVLNLRERKVSLSQIVRAAIAHFEEHGDWDKARGF